MTKSVPVSTPPLRVALYLRVSTDDQAKKEEGSLDTQEARLRSAVAARANRCEIRHVFREEGESGKTLDRPELQRLLAAVRCGEVDLLMVTRVDRLSRSLLDFFEVNRLLEKHKVQFHSLHDTFDTTTHVGRAMLSIVLVFAELERAQTAERTATAMRARAERGLWNGGSPPLGYISQGNGHLDVDPTEGDLVKLIFDQYLEMRSTTKLAKWLNERGHRQKAFVSRRKGATGGKPFTTSVLLGMLKNRLYLGEITHKGAVFAGQHTALVSAETFESARQIIGNNDRNIRPAPNRAKYEYLLTGTLRCACGYALTSSSAGAAGRGYSYYRCTGLKNPDTHSCAVRNVRADRIDATVVDIIRSAARDPQMVADAVQEANRLAQQTVEPLRERVTLARRDLASAERAADHALDAIIAAGAQQSPTSHRRLSEADAKVAQTRFALQELEAELGMRQSQQLDAEVMAQALGSFNEAFDGLTTEEKRDFLRLMIKQVVVYTDRVVVDLAEGRQATGSLVAATAAKTGNPGREDRGFVAVGEWLPLGHPTENIPHPPPR